MVVLWSGWLFAGALAAPGGDAWREPYDEGLAALEEGALDRASSSFEEAARSGADGGLVDAAQALVVARRGRDTATREQAQADASWQKQVDALSTRDRDRRAQGEQTGARLLKETEAAARLAVGALRPPEAVIRQRVADFSTKASLLSWAEGMQEVIGVRTGVGQALDRSSDLLVTSHSEWTRLVQDHEAALAELEAAMEGLDSEQQMAQAAQRDAARLQLWANLEAAMEALLTNVQQDFQQVGGQAQMLEAMSLDWGTQSWATQVVDYTTCMTSGMQQAFSVESSDWLSPACGTPGAPPSVRTRTSLPDLIQLGVRKQEQAAASGPMQDHWLMAARRLADRALERDPRSAEGWFLKASVTSEVLARVAYQRRGVDLSGRGLPALERDLVAARDGLLAAIQQNETQVIDRAALAGVHWMVGESLVLTALAENHERTLAAVLNAFQADLRAMGHPLLLWSTAANWEQSVATLVRSGAEATRPDRMGRTPYFFAVATGATRAEALLSQGVNELQLMGLAESLGLEAVADRLGQRGLVHAIDAGDLNFGSALLKARPGLLDVPLNDTDRLVSWAARAGRADWLSLALDHGGSPDSADQRGVPALQLTIGAKQADALTVLLDAGVDVNIASAPTGERALHVAMDQGEQWIRRLLDAGALIDLQDHQHQTAVHHGVMVGQLDSLQTVLTASPDLTIQDAQGATPLHLALRQRRGDLAMAVLDRSIAMDALDREGSTPLHLAIAKGLTQIQPLLLARGARFDIPDVHGDQALHVALRVGDVPMAHYLVDLGASIDAQNLAGERPLHLAAQTGDLTLVDRALEAGGSVQDSTLDGTQPLHYAAAGGNLEIVKLFLHLGADKRVKDGSRRTPAKIARRAGYPKVAKVISKHRVPKSPR